MFHSRTLVTLYRGIPNQVRRLIDTMKSDPVSLTPVTEFDSAPMQNSNVIISRLDSFHSFRR